MNKKLIINSASIISSRAIYGLNWYNISPIFILIMNDLSLSLDKIGLLPTAFLFGAAMFNIPSGIIAYKIGAKRTAMIGMYILSIFTILSGLAQNFYTLLIFRFIVGVGAGLYFAPIIKLLRIIFSRERQGLALGLYSAAFNLGAGIGIASWYVVASYTGWRSSLIIAGILGILITLENHLILPNDNPNKIGNVLSIFKNKNVLGIGLGCAGFWGSYFTTSQFYDTYIIKALNIDSSYSGIISSAILIAGVIGGPILGSFSDLFKKRRTFLIILTMLMAIDIATIPFSNYFLAILNSIFIGFISAGVFSIMYAVPSLDNSISNELIPLALGIVNTLQIALGSTIPYIFAFIAHSSSFTYSWFMLSIYSVITLPILKIVNIK